MRPGYIAATRSRNQAHDREVVADEEEAAPPAKFCKQQQHLRLDRDVERRDRLVRHDQLGLDRERAGDADAQALSAAELVREAAERSSGQADFLEESSGMPTPGKTASEGASRAP